jgi:putative ABC transport system ATP-binding protein
MWEKQIVNHLLKVTGLSKSYPGEDDRQALQDIDLEMPAGEFLCIMGPSGSGKSTLLNIVAGLDRPTRGTVTVDGVEVSRLNESKLARYRRRQVGLVFQFFNLLNTITVLDNVVLPAQLSGNRRGSVERAKELLTRLRIDAKADQFPSTLSGGERQRVAIARALINKPALLLADEPTGALDSKNGEQVMDLLSELNQDGQSIVMVTHDGDLAGRYASRIIRLHDGRIAQDERRGGVNSQADGVSVKHAVQL